MSSDSDAWVGAVVRSGIDARVWVAVLPDVDTHDGAMQASTSLRKCKAHVERVVAAAPWDGPVSVRWELSDDSAWDAYLTTPSAARAGDHNRKAEA